MNDDEWPETIEPLLKKLKKYKKQKVKHYGDALGFLKHWKTPVTEDNMEQLTGPGAQDARNLGKTLADHYSHLLPKANEPAIK